MSKNKVPAKSFDEIKKAAILLPFDADAFVSAVVDLDLVAAYESAKGLLAEADECEAIAEKIQKAFEQRMQAVKTTAITTIRARDAIRHTAEATIAEAFKHASARTDFVMACELERNQKGNDQELREKLCNHIRGAVWAQVQSEFDRIQAELDAMADDIRLARREHTLDAEAGLYYEKATLLRAEAASTGLLG